MEESLSSSGGGGSSGGVSTAGTGGTLADTPTSQRDAVVAGLIAGPLSMLPAILFFVAMIAFYPAIGAETLPS